MNAERRSSGAADLQRATFAPPGTVIAYSAPSTGIFLGSPTLVRCVDGSLLTSHDHFGPATTPHQVGPTFLYRSRDEGRTWTPLGEIRQLTLPGPDRDGLYWNSFFHAGGSLHSIGAASSGGDLVIRRSVDHGASWSPVGATRGRLIASTDGRAHASGPLTVPHAGRLWTVVEHHRSDLFGDTRIIMLSAAADADLLEPAAWVASNGLVRDPAWLGGTFQGWLEGCPVPTREGGLVAMLRVDNRAANGAAIGMKAAIVRVQPGRPGERPTLSFSGRDFDPADPLGSGFVDFPGGCVRFIVRYDAPSDRYWSICNYIPPTYRNPTYNAERFRAVLVLVSSPNLRDWTVERTLIADVRLESPDPAVRAAAFSGPFGGGYYHTLHGFQYPCFLIEGDDLLVTIRTAFTDAEGGPRAGHDANYYLFQRIVNFRKRQAGSKL